MKVSADVKVAPVVIRRKSKTDVKVRNTFGLPAGDSCPGQTRECASKCYAANLERYRPQIKRVMDENLAELKAARTVAGMADVIRPVIAQFRTETDRHRADKVFRIHWDGDFYSITYAKAWRVVIDENPDITFWAYTRSFQANVNVIPVLATASNLNLYLSVDSENATRARTVAKRHPTVRVATMAETVAQGTGLLERLGRGQAPACPENVRKIPIAVGRRNAELEIGETGQGACVACGLCVHGRADVRFATSHR